MVEIYTIGELSTLFMKNISSVMYGEQQLVINDSSVLVIVAHEKTSLQKLTEVHKKNTKGSKFKTTFEVIFKKKLVVFCYHISFPFMLGLY